MIYSVPFPATCFVDCKAPNILFRSRRLFFCATGLRLIDSLFTIASGQRELITSITHSSATSYSSSAHPSDLLRPTPPYSQYLIVDIIRPQPTILSCTKTVQDKPYGYRRPHSSHHRHQHHRVIESSVCFTHLLVVIA